MCKTDVITNYTMVARCSSDSVRRTRGPYVCTTQQLVRRPEGRPPRSLGGVCGQWSPLMDGVAGACWGRSSTARPPGFGWAAKSGGCRATRPLQSMGPDDSCRLLGAVSLPSTCGEHGTEPRPEVVPCQSSESLPSRALPPPPAPSRPALPRRGLVSDPAALLSYANQLRVAGGALDHLAGLRDVFEVHLTQAGGGAAGAGAAGALPAAAGSTAAGTMGVAAGVGAEAVGGGAGGLGDGSAGAGGEHEGDAVWVCPVTQLRCSRNATVALRPCGHVVSERAVRSLAAAADRSCPVCCKAYDSTVVLCGTAEQVAELRARLREGKGKGKGREGKEGKGKKRKAEGELDGKEAGA